MKTEFESCYLGDGLYAEFDGIHVVLWAHRDGQRHEVYLEPDVVDSLVLYVKRLRKVEEL